MRGGCIAVEGRVQNAKLKQLIPFNLWLGGYAKKTGCCIFFDESLKIVNERRRNCDRGLNGF